MATDLGKVGMVMKGTWSSSATYEIMDVVAYNNGLYVAKTAVPAGTVPTNTTYWQLAIGNFKYKPTVLYSTAFTYDNTVTLTDSIANYDFLVIYTGDSTNSSSTRGCILAQRDSLSGRYFNDFVNSYMRLTASTDSFRYIAGVDGSSQPTARYIHTILGYSIGN